MVRRLVDAWKDGDVQLLDQLLNQDKRSDPTNTRCSVLQAKFEMDAGD